MTDYYSILELTHEATIDDVKRAYRRLARKYHPDVNSSPNAQEKFIAITEAYEFLLHKLTQPQGRLYSQYSTAGSKEAQEIIDEWLKSERERIRARARKHARMRYSQFKKTKYFRATDTRQNQVLALVAIFVGFFIIFGSINGTLKVISENEKLRNINYIGSFVIIFIVGMIITTVGFVRLIKPWLKKEES